MSDLLFWVTILFCLSLFVNILGLFIYNQIQEKNQKKQNKIDGQDF